MAADKLVDSAQLDADLTTVANAIRAKGGTARQLAFPGGFAQAVSDLPSGGGVTVEALSATENGTYTAPEGKAYSPVTVNVPSDTETLAALINRTLTSISIPAGPTKVGAHVFDGASTLQSVVIPEGVLQIDAYAFSACAALVSVSLPSTLQTIGAVAFNNCGALTSIEIPASVTSIALLAFGSCTSLQRVTFRGTTPPTIANSNAFQGLPTSCVIHVPAGTLAAYTAAANYPDPGVYSYVEDGA